MKQVSRSVAGGFTLVEVIVALTLVSLIMLGLVSALRTFGDTASALDARSGRSAEARLLADFLRATLTRATPQPKVRTAEGGAVVPFFGAANEIRWLGNLPARHGAGGMHYLRLYASAGRLYLQYLPHPGNAEPPDWSQAVPHLLSERLDQMRIAYQIRPGQPGQAGQLASQAVVVVLDELAIFRERLPRQLLGGDGSLESSRLGKSCRGGVLECVLGTHVIGE